MSSISFPHPSVAFSFHYLIFSPLILAFILSCAHSFLHFLLLFHFLFFFFPQTFTPLSFYSLILPFCRPFTPSSFHSVIISLPLSLPHLSFHFFILSLFLMFPSPFQTLIRSSIFHSPILSFILSLPHVSLCHLSRYLQFVLLLFRHFTFASFNYLILLIPNYRSPSSLNFLTRALPRVLIFSQPFYLFFSTTFVR